MSMQRKMFKMRMPFLVAMAALLLNAAPGGAQGDRNAKPGGTAAAETPQGAKVPQAPVGHRQPTTADVPRDRVKDAAELERERRDRELDAKLRICRGC